MKFVPKPVVFLLVLPLLLLLSMKPLQAPTKPAPSTAKATKKPVVTFYATSDWKDATLTFRGVFGSPTEVVPSTAANDAAASELIWRDPKAEVHLKHKEARGMPFVFVHEGVIWVACSTAKEADKFIDFFQKTMELKVKEHRSSSTVNLPGGIKDDFVFATFYVPARIPKDHKIVKGNNPPLVDQPLGVVHNPNYPGK